MSGMAFPDPVDPDDPGRGPMIMGLNYSFTILAIVAVALRFWVRKSLKHLRLGWEDWVMLVAVIFQVVCEALFALSFHAGFGKHDYSIQMPDQFVEIMKWAWIAQGFGQVTSILARVSITLSLVTIFEVHLWFKWYLYVLQAIQLVLGCTMLVLSYAQARPIEGLWNVFMPGVWRMDPYIFICTGYLTQSVYTFADVSYVLIPVVIIWRLNMALHQRLGLIVLLAAMLFTAAMSILKTYTIHWQGDPTVTDPLYRNSLQVLYANLEQTFVIIMGCVPSLRSLAKIELPAGLSKLGASLNSLLGRSRTTVGGSKASSKQMGNSGRSGASSRFGHSPAPTGKAGSLSGGSEHVDLEGGWHDGRYHEPKTGVTHRELEMSTRKLGDQRNAAPVVAVSTYNEPPTPGYQGYGHGEHGRTGSGDGVRRTDQFEVSYQTRHGQ